MTVSEWCAIIQVIISTCSFIVAVIGLVYKMTRK